MPRATILRFTVRMPERDDTRINRPLDLDKSVAEIITQASGLRRSI